MGRKKNIGKYQQQQKLEQLKAEKKKRNRMILGIVAAAVLVAVLVGVLIWVLSGDDGDGKVDTSDAIKVAMEIKDYGKITLELYPNEAPISVENFVNLVEDGFYSGLNFHRVIENFMIQGGAGTGESALKPIKGEFSANGVENDLKFDRGVIGMARTNAPDSATSQFFIMHKKNENLDGLYAAFGKVIDGMDVVDAIATCEKTDVIDGDGNRYIPAKDIIIEKAYIVK